MNFISGLIFMPQSNSQFFTENNAESFLILSYEEAYSRLTRFIHQKYWRSEPVAVKPGRPSTPLPLYQTKKDAQFYNMRFFGSGEAGEVRLNILLKNIHAAQDTKNEGCLVLLRWLDDVLTSKNGFYFPGDLAQAITNGLFNVRESDNNVRLSGSRAVSARQEVENFHQKAVTRFSKYSASFSTRQSEVSDDTVFAAAALM